MIVQQADAILVAIHVQLGLREFVFSKVLLQRNSSLRRRKGLPQRRQRNLIRRSHQADQQRGLSIRLHSRLDSRQVLPHRLEVRRHGTWSQAEL